MKEGTGINLGKKVKAMFVLCALVQIVSAGPNDSDWIQLFNGENLDGWDFKIRYQDLNVDPNNTFKVEDGILKVDYSEYTNFNGEPFGHIFYDTPYSYYLLSVEYKFEGEQVSGGPGWAFENNGLMLHSQSAESMGKDQNFPISIEVQLLHDKTLNLCTPGTAVYLNGQKNTNHCIDAQSHSLDHLDWVPVEVVVRGYESFTHIIEGDTVHYYEKPIMSAGNVAGNTVPIVEDQELHEGYISLQGESAPTWFRKIELLNLKGCMDENAGNYKSYYVESDPSSCVAAVEGCTDPTYLEHNPNANVNVQDSCKTVKVEGCMDANYREYNPDANVNVQDSCVTGVELVYEGRSFGVEVNESELVISIAQPGNHSIRIYDVNGNLAAERNGKGAGKHSFKDLRKAGMHFIRITTPQGVVEKRVFLF